MPKPIQHLVETIGPKPTLLGSGALSLGGATLSTASFAVGFFTLLAATGVLPNGLASLGLAGGIVFTAAGPIGLLTSAGFFVFMATRVRSALQTRPTSGGDSSGGVDDIVKIEEVEEEEDENASTLNKIYLALDTDLDAIRKKPEGTTQHTEFFYLSNWPNNQVYLRANGDNNHNFSIGIIEKIDLKLTRTELMDLLVVYIRNNYECEILEREKDDPALILDFGKTQTQEVKKEETGVSNDIFQSLDSAFEAVRTKSSDSEDNDLFQVGRDAADDTISIQIKGLIDWSNQFHEDLSLNDLYEKITQHIISKYNGAKIIKVSNNAFKVDLTDYKD